MSVQINFFNFNIFFKTVGTDSDCNQGKVNVRDDEQTRRIKWDYV
jgi:hypothetical protein